MLNEERKKLFLKRYSSTESRSLRSILTRLFELEEEKDLCEYSKQEMLSMYKSLNISVGTLYSYNNMFTKYVDWCISEGYYDGENIGSQIKLGDLMRVSKNHTVMTIDELMYVANTYNNPIDKMLILAPFYGFSTKDEYADYTIDREKVDEINGIVALPGRKITVPTSFCDLLLECFDTYMYNINGALHPISGDGLVKVKGGVEDNVDISTLIRSKYARRFRKDYPEVSYGKTTDSGIVHYSKKYASENRILSSEQLWRDGDYIETVLGRFNSKKINKRTFYDRYAPLIFSLEP